MQLVTFVKKHPPFNIGETATFLPAKADALVKAGVAVEGERRVDGAVTPPDSARVMQRALRKGDLVRAFIKGEGDVTGKVVKASGSGDSKRVTVQPEDGGDEREFTAGDVRLLNHPDNA